MAGQRAVLVLGPGRSGTSTLTRGLQALGVFLGTSFRRPVRKNPRGNFEERHLLDLSKKARSAVGLRAESVRLLDDSVWSSPELERCGRQVAAVIEREFAGHPVWAFKYAGSGRLLPFWLDLLPRLGIEPAFAFAYRNPLSVARSRAQLDRMRGRQEQNNLEWLAHVVPFFNLLAPYPTVVVDYDRMIADPQSQLARLAGGLGIEETEQTRESVAHFATEFIRPDWRHSRFTDEDLAADPETQPLLRRAALLLSRLARDEITMQDPGLWAEWEEIQRAHRELATVLNLVDRLQDDLRTARWWDLSRPLKLGWNKMPLLRAR
ncbi:MAG: hypothetical protein JJT88_11695 [Gammaproteobacteria bacterium]|nr:hypothetical protein [Gammaproteobacteria bacterium]